MIKKIFGKIKGFILDHKVHLVILGVIGLVVYFHLGV